MTMASRLARGQHQRAASTAIEATVATRVFLKAPPTAARAAGIARLWTQGWFRTRSVQTMVVLACVEPPATTAITSAVGIVSPTKRWQPAAPGAPPPASPTLPMLFPLATGPRAGSGARLPRPVLRGTTNAGLLPSPLVSMKAALRVVERDVAHAPDRNTARPPHARRPRQRRRTPASLGASPPITFAGPEPQPPVSQVTIPRTVEMTVLIVGKKSA
jgi:hypothetical protein